MDTGSVCGACEECLGVNEYCPCKVSALVERVSRDPSIVNGEFHRLGRATSTDGFCSDNSRVILRLYMSGERCR